MRTLDNHVFEKYQAEAQKKWGQTSAYQQHTEKTKEYSKDKWNALAEDMDHIMAQFAICMKDGQAADSQTAQELVAMLQNHITENYYHCTASILASLGQMYVTDERFKRNIDQHGDGTAAYICQAIAVYCRQ